MRHFASLLAIGCVLTSASPSWAFSLDYAALPQGNVTQMPDQASAPHFVGKGKATPGFLLTAQAFDSPKREYAIFQLAANQVDADWTSNGAVAASPDDTFEFNTCFQVLPLDAISSPVRDWPGGGEPVVSMMMARNGSKAPGRLYAAHAEHWVETGDGPVIEMSDAWIDLATHGVRVFRQSRLPLVKVTQPYPGVTIYAARTAHSVEFVVRLQGRENKLGGQIASQLGQRMVFARGNESGSVACGFVRIGLNGEPGEGQVANAVTEVAVGLEPQDKAAVGLSPELNPAKVPARELTLRTLQLNLSVSRLSTDPHPVASVSYGFFGEERRVSL